MNGIKENVENEGHDKETAEANMEADDKLVNKQSMKK
jgi:hypothetical protein